MKEIFNLKITDIVDAMPAVENPYLNKDEENIRELKEALAFGFELQNALVKTFEDKKVSWTDGWHFWGPVRTVAPAFNNLGSPVKRYTALSADGRTILRAEFREKFNLPDDELELLIEDTVVYLEITVVKGVEIGRRWVNYFRTDNDTPDIAG